MESLVRPPSPKNLVALDRDHPGFRDAAYRARRDAIAALALAYRDGDPVPDVAYTDDEHAVWREVMRSLAPLHAQLACRAFVDGAAQVALPSDRIPQLSEVNRALGASTGFALWPVAGLVDARTFLSYLARDVFLSTQYVRHGSRPLYTPEPDVIHELVGHAATFTLPALARLNRAFGRAIEGASDERAIEIARVYWYTIEFGAVREPGGIKAYGAGLLSSCGEIARFKHAAELRPFDLDAMAARPFDPTDYQAVIFVVDGFEQLEKDVTRWLERPIS